MPVGNLVRRAMASLTQTFENAKAAHAAVIDSLKAEKVQITGAIQSSITSILAIRRVHWRRNQRRPHQGTRECARRRGDWKLVSAIDARKRYPYGINHRYPSINRPDRSEISVLEPTTAAGGRILLPHHMR